MKSTPENVLTFWFEELSEKEWFSKNLEVDKAIKTRFLPTYKQAAQCELFSWRQDLRGRLAEIIVLDQFPRNIFRDSPQAFATDALALALAQEAVSSGDHSQLRLQERAFLYMPFMHSESPLIHERAIELFSAPGLEYNLDFEKRHKVIIDRFGRYPHRNQLLGRTSTPEEHEYLESGGDSF